MRRGTVLAAIVLAALEAAAQKPAPDPSQPYPLTVKAGESIAVCKTGTIQCPASNAICDDASVVAAANGNEGLLFKGLKPGSTLCSAATGSGIGPRRVYRVTVAP